MKRFLLLFAILFSANALAQDTYTDPAGRKHYMGLKQPANWRKLTTWDKPVLAGEPLPEKFNWNDKFKLQEVRNQSSCGSCWAFSVTAVLESLFRIAHQDDLKYDLAEQETLSCSNAGSCGGGYFNAFNYLAKHGLGHEDDFPYKARDLSCKSIPTIAKAKEWHYIGDEDGSPSIEEMKTAIFNYGPISVDVNGNFGSYESGVYKSCGSTSTNHMTVIDGWVDDPAYASNGGGYWVMRNSWGSSWGEAGYMKIVYKSTSGRKCNGIGGVAAYAVLEGIPNLREYLRASGRPM